MSLDVLSLHAFPSYSEGHTEKSGFRIIGQRIRDAKLALDRAEDKARRCRQVLDRLMSLQADAETSHWTEFRTRLRVGKLWASGLDQSRQDAVEVRELLAPFCDAQGRRTIYAQAFPSERAALHRALVLGSLLCERAKAHHAAELFLESMLDESGMSTSISA